MELLAIWFVIARLCREFHFLEGIIVDDYE